MTAIKTSKRSLEGTCPSVGVRREGVEIGKDQIYVFCHFPVSRHFPYFFLFLTFLTMIQMLHGKCLETGETTKSLLMEKSY